MVPKMIFQDKKGLLGFACGSSLEIDVRNLKIISLINRAYDAMSAKQLTLT